MKKEQYILMSTNVIIDQSDEAKKKEIFLTLLMA